MPSPSSLSVFLAGTSWWSRLSPIRDRPAGLRWCSAAGICTPVNQSPGARLTRRFRGRTTVWALSACPARDVVSAVLAHQQCLRCLRSSSRPHLSHRHRAGPGRRILASDHVLTGPRQGSQWRAVGVGLSEAHTSLVPVPRATGSDSPTTSGTSTASVCRHVSLLMPAARF